MTNADMANRSQKIVADFLTLNGFTIAEVSSPFANGIDIVAIKNNCHLRIEVKTAGKTTRSWRAMKPNKDSDYIAIVMPSGYIHFDHIDDWKKLCSIDGSRRITKLFNLYSLFKDLPPNIARVGEWANN